ncbi:MAG TPA: phosphotransferase [Kofleriaceae bacterium]
MMDHALGEAVAAAYPLGPIRACVRLDRISSSVARVEIAERVCWLKLVTRAHRGLDELESEAEVASELAECGLRVAPAVRRRDGRYAGMLALPDGAVPAVMFDEAPGGEVEAPSPAQANALGALLGSFHAAAVRAADRRWRIDADALGGAPLRAVEAWLERAGGDAAREVTRRCAELGKLAAEMVAIAWPDGASLPMGLCHGDLQLENVRFDGAQPALFDLECCGTGPCAYDLACYWRRRIGLAPTDAEPPRAEWDALLRGYQQTRALGPLERQAIPALATLRAVWVMALPATPGTTWGQDWLLDPEYIDAHVAMIQRLARIARCAG